MGSSYSMHLETQILIVNETLEKAEKFDTVIVYSIDTDVFIALLYHLSDQSFHFIGVRF